MPPAPGTAGAPGVLSGTYYSDVIVQGVCAVNGGAANVHGNLVVSPGSALLAIFALNDVAGTGTSSLTVGRSIYVQNGGSLALGCEPNFSPCADDPGGTLTGSNHVYGDLVSTQPLGVLLHATTINGNVFEAGGGGGVNCTPTGIFTLFQSPVFSDYEDNTIGGNLVINGLQTCWLGSLRNTVGGSVIDTNNTTADPDAGEVLQNTIRGNLVCLNNSPAVQFGDSGASPIVVGGNAIGQCGFGAAGCANPAGLQDSHGRTPNMTSLRSTAPSVTHLAACSVLARMAKTRERLTGVGAGPLA